MSILDPFFFSKSLIEKGEHLPQLEGKYTTIFEGQGIFIMPEPNLPLQKSQPAIASLGVPAELSFL